MPAALSPARLTQMMVEFVFVLLGLLVVWLGLSGRIYFDRRGVGWLVVSVALVVWGMMAFAKQGQWWAKQQKFVRGGSLVLLGLAMLAMSRIPFLWVPRLLMAAGVILILRGLLSSVLILRQR